MTEEELLTFEREARRKEQIALFRLLALVAFFGATCIACSMYLIR